MSSQRHVACCMAAPSHQASRQISPCASAAQDGALKPSSPRYDTIAAPCSAMSVPFLRLQTRTPQHRAKFEHVRSSRDFMPWEGEGSASNLLGQTRNHLALQLLNSVRGGQSVQ